MLYHDMTNDYKKREYRVTVTLQEGYFKGEIYYEYIATGAAGHGLGLDTVEDIFIYLTNLEYSDNDDLDYYVPDKTGGFELHNNCGFRIDRDNYHVNFILKDESGNKIEKTIPKFELEKYIVGVSISSCIGRGVKRDSRKCVICKNFNRIGTTASGICLAKNKKVSQGTTICKFDFAALDNKN